MLKQGQNTLALPKHKHIHSVQCEGWLLSLHLKVNGDCSICTETQAACLRRRASLFGWFILLSCLNLPSVFLYHFVHVWFRSWGCSLLAQPDRSPNLDVVQTEQEPRRSGAFNPDFRGGLMHFRYLKCIYCMFVCSHAHRCMRTNTFFTLILIC